MELDRLKKQINLLDKAYKTLKSPLNEGINFNDLEKDGIIQRFEYTIELTWKTSKKFLEYKKVNFMSTPKDIFREMFKLDIINEIELWDDFLDIRNLMSHMYSEYTSLNSFEYINENHYNIGILIKKLKKIVNS